MKWIIISNEMIGKYILVEFSKFDFLVMISVQIPKMIILMILESY